jgi:hypothetical protein
VTHVLPTLQLAKRAVIHSNHMPEGSMYKDIATSPLCHSYHGLDGMMGLDRRLGGPQNRSERYEEEKNSQPLEGIEPQSFSP